MHIKISFSSQDISLFKGKLLNKKGKVNFNIYDFTSWETTNYNTHISQYLNLWHHKF